MMGRSRRDVWALVVAILLGMAGGFVRAAEQTFPLKDGDVWVMVGDSITAQHLHSNYFEAFCYARFGGQKFCFRNSGVGGDTIPRVLARFDWDVACWKPTVVSVELGMNDAGGFKTDQYMANMVKLVDRIRKAGARPVLFAPSPVNIGGVAANWVAWNKTLASFSASLGAYAAKEGIPYANQFEMLHPWWERNTADLHAIDAIRRTVDRKEFPGQEHLVAWMKFWDEYKGIRPVVLEGDPVHPGPPGQLTMSAALLLGLKAPGRVGLATIDAAEKKLAESTDCKIEDLKVADDQISFARLDSSLPMPIPPQARAVLPLMPSMADLSHQVLKVTGLKGKTYDVTIDGAKVASAGADQLAAGWDTGLMEAGPIAAQCRNLLDLVAAKEKIVTDYRTIARAVADKKAQPDAERSADLMRKIERADAAIREAAQPKSHRYVLTPAP